VLDQTKAFFSENKCEYLVLILVFYLPTSSPSPSTLTIPHALAECTPPRTRTINLHHTTPTHYHHASPHASRTQPYLILAISLLHRTITCHTLTTHSHHSYHTLATLLPRSITPHALPHNPYKHICIPSGVLACSTSCASLFSFASLQINQ
jgi:hypothetical protein